VLPLSTPLLARLARLPSLEQCGGSRLPACVRSADTPLYGP
jgi:hypothetical protein